MVGKAAVLRKAGKFLKKRDTITCRACKLLRSGDFNGVLSSRNLTHLLNESAGKKVRASDLTAYMQPLLDEAIVRIIDIGEGPHKRKYWFPGWMSRTDAEGKVTPVSAEHPVCFFSGKDAWTDANEEFAKAIETLEGDLCIVDPYYGHGTFYVLAQFGKETKIRFLSCQLGREEKDNKPKFDIGLRRFRKEFRNIEMRRHDDASELHDRYIIADNALVIIGHGIKDLANRESFVIFLCTKSVEKFLPKLKMIFEERWRKGRRLE